MFAIIVKNIPTNQTWEFRKSGLEISIWLYTYEAFNFNVIFRITPSCLNNFPRYSAQVFTISYSWFARNKYKTLLFIHSPCWTAVANFISASRWKNIYPLTARDAARWRSSRTSHWIFHEKCFPVSFELIKFGKTFTRLEKVLRGSSLPFGFF